MKDEINPRINRQRGCDIMIDELKSITVTGRFVSGFAGLPSPMKSRSIGARVLDETLIFLKFSKINKKNIKISI